MQFRHLNMTMSNSFLTPSRKHLKVHLTIAEGASPMIRSARTLPESRKNLVKAELQLLVDTGMIVPVNEPTDWVSQMSVAEKKSGVRICIDPHPLKQALKREHYKLPVLEDILPELSQACKISVCDLKAGYLHCEFDHPLSLLTTFVTPFGRYCYCRLPFGLTVSSEILQKGLHQALEGLQGVCCIADDVLIWGHTDDEHDEREIPFMAHVVSRNGLKPDPTKIEAIVKMKPPTDKAGIERPRGTVDYLLRLIPKLSDVMCPINDLTHPNVEWTWDSVHDKAFEEIKSLLTQAPVLAYFDWTKQLAKMVSLSIAALISFFAEEKRSIERGENHYRSEHIESFSYHQGVLRGEVQASMKKKVYRVTELSQLGLGWDDKVSPEVKRKWMVLFEEMIALNNFKFKHCLTLPNSTGNPALVVVFSDALRWAFGACACMKWKLNVGQFGTCLKLSQKNDNSQVQAGPPSTEEIQDAKEYWAKKAQTGLSGRMEKGDFKTLSPFTDEKGIIRVGGRLDLNLLSYDGKSPVLLTYHHWMSTLVTRDAHRRDGSKGGDPANCRLQPYTPPFLYASCDYFGPIKVRVGRSKMAKHYGVIFTCLNTRAVHCELATNLTTMEFLQVLRRFFSYRGYTKVLISNNGSQMNFAHSYTPLMAGPTSSAFAVGGDNNVTGEQIHGPTSTSSTDKSCQRDLMETNTPKEDTLQKNQEDWAKSFVELENQQPALVTSGRESAQAGEQREGRAVEKLSNEPKRCVPRKLEIRCSQAAKEDKASYLKKPQLSDEEELYLCNLLTLQNCTPKQKLLLETADHLFGKKFRELEAKPCDNVSAGQNMRRQSTSTVFSQLFTEEMAAGILEPAREKAMGKEVLDPHRTSLLKNLHLGRQDSNSCTIIAVKFGDYCNQNKLEISLLWTYLPQMWTTLFVNANCDGNDLYDELYGETAVYLDIEDVARSLVQQPSYGVIIACEKSVGIYRQPNGLCALIDSHVHNNNGAIIVVADSPSKLINLCLKEDISKAGKVWCLEECFKEAKAIAGIKRMQGIEPSPTKGKVLSRLYSSQPGKSNHDNVYSYCESFYGDSRDVSIPEDPMPDGSQETDGNHAISSNVEITDNVSRSADCTCTFAALCMQSTEQLANDIHLGLPEEIQKCFDNSNNVNLHPSSSSLAQLIVNGSIEFGGNTLISLSDLKELDCKGDTDEEKWIPNFVNDSYLHFIKSECSHGQCTAEVLKWDEFEKVAVEKIKEKKLLQQDIILIPCNSGGRHWVLCAILCKEKSVIVLDSLSGEIVKPSTQDILSKVITMLRFNNSTTDFQQEEWSLYVNMCKEIPQQQNGYDCSIFTCMYAGCLAKGCPMVVQDNIPALRQVMIVELHQRKLYSIPGPTVKVREYYAVAFVQNFYFGRVLKVSESSVTLKFLHRVGAETFHWLGRDDVLQVHQSCIFFGPITVPMFISGPFKVPELQCVQNLIKAMNRSKKA
ncbi:Retrovirus-related Pol polyprotein from transposon 17.6 [Stylophora pistillata]|uniref:Retrovirus-related Pol polyprotein from transposon 17.6 n=1 Tax=Stylophora pistillata TaxID=50429 RepID=A0A2B4S8R3_STYPI|nr:Retrovirus-related Pol polyprotein from transposon 17.6 [Stylophora pistillata]